MSERWRRPVVPLDVGQAQAQGLWLPDGRVQGEVQIVLRREDVERMRAGYVCAKCLEPFERAWPERCPVCGAPIRTEQAAYFGRQFEAEIVHLGSRVSLEEEVGMLEEHRRKEEEQEAKSP